MSEKKIQKVLNKRLPEFYLEDIKIIVMLILMQCALVSTAQESSDSDSPVSLNEVEVKANGLIVGHDKIMLNVDKNLRKHSYDGYSLLNAAMIPGLEVNPFDRTVKSENESVLLCINGVEASQGEIRTLNPKDVQRIDFYTGYDPRHPDSRFTLDFIVKIRESGGAVVLEARQHLNRLTGSDMADWRMYRGKTELGVRLEGNYDSYAQGLYEEENMLMAFDRGDVMMEVSSSIDRKRSQSLRAKPYLVWRRDNETLKITFALQQQHASQNLSQLEQYERLSELTVSDARIHSHSDRLLPSMSGMYQHKYSASRYLNVFFNGNYSHTDKSRDYMSIENVASNTRENFYGGSATVQYSFGFSDTQRGFVSAGGGMNHSRISYEQNERTSLSHLTTGTFRLAVGDNWRVSRSLSLNLVLSGDVTSVANDKKTTRRFSFIPSLRANWTIAQGHSLSYNISFRSQRPPMSYYSSDEKWLMPYIRQVGNPDLKMSNIASMSLNYRDVQKWGYLELFGSYTATTRSVYYDIRCDDARDVYIQTFRNGGTYHNLNVGPRAQFKIVPGHLTLRVGGSWDYTRIETWHPLHKHTLRADANLMYMGGGFTANVKCTTPGKALDELGCIGYVPWDLQISANYVINNFTVGATVRNPFMTTPTRSESVLPGITESSRYHSSRSRYNMVAVTISYRFNYGKEKKKYDEVELQENEDSAILGH